MKKALILTLALVMCSSLAFAQNGGHIGIYSDAPGYTDCNLVEAPGAPNLVYVVHNTAAQANTSQFKVDNNWGAFQAGENSGGNLFIASTLANTIYDGGTITYVGCKPLPHLLVTLTLIPFVPSGPCPGGLAGALAVVPDPVLPSGQIEVVDCDGSTVWFATGGVLSVNDDGNCQCVVATEETSWSRIKAMYQ